MLLLFNNAFFNHITKTEINSKAIKRFNERKLRKVLTEQNTNIQDQENELSVNKKRKIITSKYQIIAANNSILQNESQIIMG